MLNVRVPSNRPAKDAPPTPGCRPGRWPAPPGHQAECHEHRDVEDRSDRGSGGIGDHSRPATQARAQDRGGREGGRCRHGDRQAGRDAHLGRHNAPPRDRLGEQVDRGAASSSEPSAAVPKTSPTSGTRVEITSRSMIPAVMASRLDDRPDTLTSTAMRMGSAPSSVTNSVRRRPARAWKVNRAMVAIDVSPGSRTRSRGLRRSGGPGGTSGRGGRCRRGPG